jgi:hypothetical protein
VQRPATDIVSILDGFPATGLIGGQKWQDFVRGTFLVAGTEQQAHSLGFHPPAVGFPGVQLGLF